LRVFECVVCCIFRLFLVADDASGGRKQDKKVERAEDTV
jgi:hypothetical protein